MLNLQNNDWRVRLYRAALDYWDQFRDEETYWKMASEGTNLCHFVRVIALYPLIIIGAHLALLGTAFAVLAVLPITWFGWLAWGIGIGAISVIIGVCALLSRVQRRREEQPERRREEHERSAPEPTRIKKVREGPSTWQLFKLWLKAKKDKLCPVIKFVDAESADAGEASHG